MLNIKVAWVAFVLGCLAAQGAAITAPEGWIIRVCE